MLIPNYFETMLEAQTDERIKPFVWAFRRLEMYQATFDFYYKGQGVLDGPWTQGLED